MSEDVDDWRGVGSQSPAPSAPVGSEGLGPVSSTTAMFVMPWHDPIFIRGVYVCVCRVGGGGGYLPKQLHAMMFGWWPTNFRLFHLAKETKTDIPVALQGRDYRVPRARRLQGLRLRCWSLLWGARISKAVWAPQNSGKMALPYPEWYW